MNKRRTWKVLTWRPLVASDMMALGLRDHMELLPLAPAGTLGGDIQLTGHSCGRDMEAKGT